MNLISIGATHQTAPVEIRERLSFTETEAKALLEELSQSGLVTESFLVSTCNRTELYAVPAREEVTAEHLKELIIERKHARKEVRPEHFFSRFACGAVKHLFEVTSGADSMILGESQILGQVKDAYRIAAETEATGTVLNRLCHQAFSVAKRVRTETKLTDGAISVSYAAVELAKKIFSDLSAKRVLLVGAGETAALAAKHLLEKRVTHISITNRTTERAEELARDLGTSSVIPFTSFSQYLGEYDIVITAVGGTGEVISESAIEKGMQARKHEPILFLDLGVPRNISPKAGSIYNVFLKDVDDLQGIVSKNLEARRAELPKVEKIVGEELVEFETWFNSLQVAPTIRDLNAKFQSILNEELERIKGKVSEEEYKRTAQVAERMMRKFLHLPISSLKSPLDTAQSTAGKINLIRALFELEKVER
ncbi:MAG: glutamyl-tRNA reductase [Chloroherpetonaceae bacterium]|nr:glutamyl-tRNA reductase [Chloroherpetonaceae bacterium]